MDESVCLLYARHICPGNRPTSGDEREIYRPLSVSVGSALMNNSGASSAVIARHDYLPFGEEVASGIGLRTTTQGYGATDTNRQKYGLTERDDTTGLDHTWFRKYDNLSGRWTSPDPYNGSMSIASPQSFNRFGYLQNDPVNFMDPSGLISNNSCGSYVLDPATKEWVWIPCSVTPVDVPIPPDWEELPGAQGPGNGITMLMPQKPSTNPCPPTGNQLASDPKVVRALNQAWRDSKPGARAGVRHEEGGWIYVHNGQTIIRRAPRGRTGDINLRNPPQVAGALLVATFHTHPGFYSQAYLIGPSSEDANWENHRGVPGLVMVEGMLIAPYGPDRRGSNPEKALDPNDPANDIRGFPGNTANSKGCP